MRKSQGSFSYVCSGGMNRFGGITMTDHEILSKLERLGRGDRDSFPMAVYGLICKKDAELMMTNCKIYQLLGQADEKRLLQKIQQAKIEAYKEFAEKAAAALANAYTPEYAHWIDDTLDVLLKEMTGEYRQ